MGSIDFPDVTLISSEITGNVIYASGCLLFVRDRRLMAQPFDASSLETTGPPVPLGEQELEKEIAFSRAGFSVSDDGLLVFQSAVDDPSRLVWLDADGQERGQVAAVAVWDPHISPDGRMLAVTSDDSQNGKHFIRVFDLERGVSTRLTDGGSEQMPIWSRDSTRITYVATTGSSYELAEVPVDRSEPPVVLVRGAKMIPNDRADDGRLLFMNFAKGPAEVTILSVSGSETQTVGLGGEAQFSPDGHWVAYTTREITVQHLSGSGARIQISSGGGAQPRWSRDGQTIYYIAPDRKLMAASFDPMAESAGAPHALFQTRIVAPFYVLFQYDVAPDGRFLVNAFPEDNTSPLTLVTDWRQQLQR